MIRLFAGGSSAWSILAGLAAGSTVVLGAGLLAAWTARRQPARGHRALVAVIVGCLVAPVAAVGVRWANVGLIRDSSSEVPPSLRPTQSGRPLSLASGFGQVQHPLETPSSPPAALTIAPVTPSSTWWDWSSLILAAWGLASGLGLVRLVGSVAAGRRLCLWSAVVIDPALRAVVTDAARACGLAVVPEVRVSASVSCPVIWCWGRCPTLILPAVLGRWAADDAARRGLGAVVGHELAHWRRRDHLASLAAEVLVVAAPWQPLAWVARNQQATLAELAADDWTLARLDSTTAPADYAEALLGWVADRRRSLVLAALTRRSKLDARVRHILKGTAPMPYAGRSWTLATTLWTLSLVALVALSQPRSPTAQAITSPEPSPMTADSLPVPSAPVTLTGVVVDPSGQPIAGVTVICLARDRQEVRAGNRRDPSRAESQPTIRGRGVTDPTGQFRIAAALAVSTPGDSEYATIVAVRPGFAPANGIVLPGLPPVRVTLGPAVPIRGRLLRPDGAPAVGVRVRLERYADLAEDELHSRSCSFAEGGILQDVPGFPPAEYATDADGRFTIVGAAPRGVFAQVLVGSPPFAVEELTVSTRLDTKPVPILTAFEVTPLAADFVHSLQRERPVVGQVRAASTGQPLAGLSVEVTPMGRHGGMPVLATTDAEGHYRVSDRVGETYFVQVNPPPGSGLIGDSRHINQWPEGASELRVDLTLRAGIVIRGRVVDAATNQPLADASVAYEPDEANAGIQESDDFRVLARTDADGRFVVTGLTGRGVIGADGPGGDWIRQPLAGVNLRHEEHAVPQGFALVDLPDGGPVPEVVIRLRRGVTLTARAILPDGSTPESVTAWCPELAARLLDNQFSPVAFVGRQLRLPGAEPGRTYRVVFLDGTKRHGAVADLRCPANPAEAIAVRLAPTATVTGRLVQPDGQPRPDVPIYAHLNYEARPGNLEPGDLWDEFRFPLQLNLTQAIGDQELRPDFRLDGLIPGLAYVLTWPNMPPSDGGRQSFLRVAPLNPGEIRAVGDLRPQPGR